MKNLILVSLVAVALVACNGTQNPTPASTTSGAVQPAQSQVDATIEAALPFIQSGANLATGAVLNFAATGADRVTLANQIWASANAVDSLATGAIPTPDALKATVLSFGGSDQTATYASYASSVAGIYATYYPKLTSGAKAKTVVDLLSAIASGVRAGAQTYQTIK